LSSVTHHYVRRSACDVPRCVRSLDRAILTVRRRGCGGGGNAVHARARDDFVPLVGQGAPTESAWADAATVHYRLRFPPTGLGVVLHHDDDDDQQSTESRVYLQRQRRRWRRRRCRLLLCRSPKCTRSSRIASRRKQQRRCCSGRVSRKSQSGTCTSVCVCLFQEWQLSVLGQRTTCHCLSIRLTAVNPSISRPSRSFSFGTSRYQHRYSHNLCGSRNPNRRKKSSRRMST
jgi:hypothetical protein